MISDENTLLLSLTRLSVHQKEILLKLLDEDESEDDLIVKMERAYTNTLNNFSFPDVPKDKNLVRASAYTLEMSTEDIEKAKGEVKSTPAKPSERRHGSKKNPEGSASTGKGIKFSEGVTESLKNKVKEQNDKHKNKVTLAELKAVYRRGAGAFSTSHRPNMTRNQWAMGRVNSFLKRVNRTGGHTEDDDLIKKSESYSEEFHSYDLESFESYISDITKAKPKYTKDKHGNIVYRGEKFAGFNKPMRDSGKKQGKVLVKEGDRIKIVRFGDPKLPDNTSVEQNDRFYSRFEHGKGKDDKFSPLYWSMRYLWPRGKMKGKGTKPFYTLKGDGSVKKSSSLNIIKAVNKEEMIAIEPLYINVGEADSHSDGITDEQLDKLVDNFNKNIGNIKGNIQHLKMIDGYHPVKAYRMPMDVFISNPKSPADLIKIPEGQPIVKVQFHDTDIGKALWEKRKSGVLMGVSIGAKGRRVPNPDYEGE